MSTPQIIINEVSCVEDLPVPVAPQSYYLPSWRKFVPNRATAWAYMGRDDGGSVVLYDGGKIYRRNTITTQTLV